MARHGMPGWAPMALALLAIAAVLGAGGVVLVTAQVADIQAVYVKGPIPLDPSDAFWQQAEKAEIPLVAQRIMYPMSGEEDVRTLRVAAAVDDSGLLAIYIEWDDPTMDVPVPGGLDVYPDMVAVQFPVKPDGLPYICMGTTEQPVSIVLWQAPDTAETLVAGSAYGMSPEQREALGLHSVPTSPIERLPPHAQVWKANAVYQDGKWKVVLYRPMASTHPMVTNFRLGETVSVAFAVWQGSKQETGAMKSTSAWFTMQLAAPAAEAPAPAAPAEEQPAPAPGEAQTVTVTETVTQTTTVTQEPETSGAANILIGGLIAAALYTIALAAYFYVLKPMRQK